MYKLLVSLLFFSSIVSVSHAGPLDRFVERLSSQCEDLNSLLVKKSMIEFHRKDGNECKGRFTNIMLEHCKKLTCRDVKNFYNRSMAFEGGSIIGEERSR
jgi:hypothetical protein